MVLAFEQEGVQKTVSRRWNHGEKTALLGSDQETSDKTVACVPWNTENKPNELWLWARISPGKMQKVPPGGFQLHMLKYYKKELSFKTKTRQTKPGQFASRS